MLKLKVIGPNTIGIISPGKSKIGIIPGFLYKEGVVGIISRSGTLTHEVASNLAIRGIEGDALIGMNFIEVLELFREDPETAAVILIGEIGGQAEEDGAFYIQESYFPKPGLAFITGLCVPLGKRMGHAGAILEKGARSAAEKMEFMSGHGVQGARKNAG